MRSKDWNELLEFETRDLVEIFLKKQYNREANSLKLQEITSNFIQGREYFKSAFEADFTVRPLLQYYGVLALTKGLILSLSPSLNETNLKPSHGLSINNWKEIVKNKRFGELEIVVGEGSFSELLKATQNSNHIRANSNKVNWHCYLTAPKNSDTIKLKELIQYFPDLSREYETWTDEKLDFAILSTYKTVDEKIEIELGNEISEELLNKLFPENYCKGRTIEGKIVKYDLCGWFPNITQLWDGAFDIGDATVIPVFKNDIGLNQLGGMYMMSYTLGMMVRYYPTTWISLRRAEKGDKVYPFIHRIIDFIDEKYPKVILDFLRNTKPN